MGTWTYNIIEIASVVRDDRVHEHLPFSAGSTNFVVNHPDWNDSKGYQLTFNTPTSGNKDGPLI